MRVVNTRHDNLDELTPDETEWVYNGLDSSVTREIDDKTEKFVTPQVRKTYEFTFRQVRPILAIMMRGVKVDEVERLSMMNEKSRALTDAQSWLDELGDAAGFGTINPRSPQQLKALFYEHMDIPEIAISFKGVRKVSTNREALEKIYVNNFHARPFIQAIFACRDLSKFLSVLRTKVSDGRFRTTFNPAGTGTGRWSSTESPFGTGGNIQNITAELRRIFLPDTGMVLGNADLRQAESFGVGYYSQDLKYIEACKSGDLHTYCARLIWPGLPWNGDLKKDKKIAELPFYRHFSHRDMSKRGGHAYNYYGTPYTISRHLKIDISVAEKFQDQYFGVFDRIPMWHKEVAQELFTTRTLTTAMGRRRIFFGRINDDAELRKAIAFLPQSTIVDILNTGLCRIWEEMDPMFLELLIQVHDSIVYQIPEHLVHLWPKVEDLMRVPVTIHGREMVIPVETLLGYIWKKPIPDRPDPLDYLGLVEPEHFKMISRPARSLLDVRL